jgi:hypothetical protein
MFIRFLESITQTLQVTLDHGISVPAYATLDEIVVLCFVISNQLSDIDDG